MRKNTKHLRIGIIVIFAIIFQINSIAQDKNFNFGFKLAPAASWLSVENSHFIKTNGAAPKFNWGFFGAYNFTENYSFISGFNVNKLGGQLKYSEFTDINVISYKYSEFQIPFLFQMKTNEIKSMKYLVQIGLAPAFLIKDKTDYPIFYQTLNNENKALNLSYILAAGIELPVEGDVALFSHLKYNANLSNLLEVDNSKIKSNFIELSLGVLF